MKAREVLSRYANGERNFRNANLRGQSFKGQDLSGADFSGADIRGADFSYATLKDANFSEAKAGLQRPQLLFHSLVASLLAALSGFVGAIFSSIFVSSFLQSSFIRDYGVLPGLAVLLAIITNIFSIAWQGLTVRAIVLAVILGGIAGTIAVAGVGTVIGTIPVMGTGIVSIAGVVMVVGAITIAEACTLAVAEAVSNARIVAVAVAMIGAVVGTSIITRAETPSGNLAVIVAVVATIMSKYIAQWALKGDEKFSPIRSFAVYCAAIGGTRFFKANLTGSDFTQAVLKNTDLRGSLLTHVCWKGTRKVEMARVGDSILSNLTVREVLINRHGYRKNYADADFRGADLTGVNLNKANLERADLSETILRQADMREANLQEALLLGADLTATFLTGACIGTWNIDHTTNLKNVDCQYVYLARANQERRPSSGEFAPGEFTKLFQEALTTVDLIFSSGVDWRAFMLAFHHVQIENEEIELTVQSIETKGGVVVVRVSVPPNADKTKIHSSFKQDYELELLTLKAAYQADLKAKDSEITIYREQSANMLEVTKLLASRSISVESTLMNNSSDQSQNIRVGRDMNLSGSTLNLGEISGSVTNTISQLQSANCPEAAQLADLLKQLQTAIETETDQSLTDDNKAEALEQVNTLAKAGKNPPTDITKKSANTAIKILRGTIAALPDTAKLAEACSKLLPAVVSLLGL